ncbi:MAG TPA: site-specific integrase [bacterium]|nr:site-specific integrase [bacterium]
MAIIKRTGSDIFYVDFRDQGGCRHRISTGTRSRRVALQIEAKLKSDAVSGKFFGPSRGQLRLATVLQRYVDWQKTMGKRWGRSDLAMRNILRVLNGSISAGRLTVIDVDRYKRERLQSVKPGTLQRELTVLIAALNRAVERGELSVNPLAGRVKQMMVAPRNRVLGDSEVNRLLAEAQNGPNYLLPALALMVGAGCRRGEALGLLWQDIDLDSGSIIIHAEKTKKSRVVPLAGWLQDILKAVPRVGATVIATNEGQAIESIKRSFHSCCERARIEHVVLHDLRRTFGTRMARAGASPWIIQSLLGHQSLRTTQMYVSISDSAMRRAVFEACPAPDGLGLGQDDESNRMHISGHK